MRQIAVFWNSVRWLAGFSAVLWLSTPLFSETLQVGVYGSAPFVIQAAGREAVVDQWQGISLELWRQIADETNREYQLQACAHLPQCLQELAEGRLDLLIGPISVTHDRAQMVDFSYPWYHAWQGLLVLQSNLSPIQFLWQFMQTGFPIALGSLIVLLFCTGLIFWLLERRANRRIPREFGPGVLKSMWFALVTFVTVGYGDVSPRTTKGRLLTSVWMLVSMLISSSIIAVMTTAFTLAEIKTSAIQEPQDLRHKRVAVIAGTTGAGFAAEHGAIPLEFQSVDQAITALVGGHSLAVVHDYPALVYQLQQHKDHDFELISARYKQENYAFALPRGSSLRRPLNLAILAKIENGQMTDLLQKYGLR
ncbi:MAG: transporter substrate-binding domain-containing protein [Leptospiraceae bacterium]|nr:transporter substrate-binding domain-containing protein [Leptospiraceae bacterium]